jgi:hypothetical protein
MKLFRRARLARRRAVLRLLNEPSQPCVPPTLTHLSEWAGHPYVCGPSTFLVALYLQRMRQEELPQDPCKKKS